MDIYLCQPGYSWDVLRLTQGRVAGAPEDGDLRRPWPDSSSRMGFMGILCF